MANKIGALIQQTLFEKNFLKRQIIKLFVDFLSDKKYLEILFKLRAGYKPNIDNPRTFNEKLQWLKLYDHKDEYTQMVDKVEAKNYVASIVGSKYIIPTIAVFNHADEIDFNQLPQQFVMKCSHNSGGIVVCKDKDKLNKDKAIKKMGRGWEKDYYKYNKEYPYKNVARRVLVEEFLSESDNQDLIDYKIHCFNGVPKLILVCKDRYAPSGLTEDFYDCEWNHLNIRRPKHPNAKTLTAKPINLEEMLQVAKKLSQNIPFIRVDLYNVNGKIYFGELTFFPASGMTAFIPNEWDLKIGEWLTLPKQ